MVDLRPWSCVPADVSMSGALVPNEELATVVGTQPDQALQVSTF